MNTGIVASLRTDGLCTPANIHLEIYKVEKSKEHRIKYLKLNNKINKQREIVKEKKKTDEPASYGELITITNITNISNDNDDNNNIGNMHITQKEDDIETYKEALMEIEHLSDDLYQYADETTKQYAKYIYKYDGFKMFTLKIIGHGIYNISPVKVLRIIYNKICSYFPNLY